MVIRAIRRLDADVISIEASRNEELRKLVQMFFSALDGGDSGGGWCSVGFGVYDVHSTRVPSEEEMRDKLKVMVDVVKENGSRSGEDLIFVNPVSGRMQSRKNQADVDFFFTGLWIENAWVERNGSFA